MRGRQTVLQASGGTVHCESNPDTRNHLPDRVAVAPLTVGGVALLRCRQLKYVVA